MTRKKRRNASLLPNQTGRSKRSCNISNRVSLSRTNNSDITNKLLGKKRLVKTYSTNQPVQVANKHHFLTPDTPDFDDIVQESQNKVEGNEVSSKDSLKTKSPLSQGVKKILHRNQTQAKCGTGSYNSLHLQESGQRFIEGQESDKSVSSCTLVNVQSSVDHGKNTSSSDVSSVGATPVMPDSVSSGGKSGAASEVFYDSVELPRHAHQETSWRYLKSGYSVVKRRKANVTSYTVKSMSNCSPGIPRTSKRYLSTVKSMTLCSSVGQVDPIATDGEEDNTVFPQDVGNCEEDDPKNSTWNENNTKLQFHEFLQGNCLSPIKGVPELSAKKRCNITKKTGQLPGSRSKKTAHKRDASSRTSRRDPLVSSGKPQADGLHIGVMGRSVPLSVQPKRGTLHGEVSTSTEPLTSTRIHSENHPLFKLDVSDIGKATVQVKAGTAIPAQGYCTEELLDYEPLPFQVSTSAGDDGGQAVEEDVTPEAEEQKLRRLSSTALKSVRRLELRTSTFPDCNVESFALGKRNKAKVSVCRGQRCLTRNPRTTNTAKPSVTDSLILV